MVEERRMRRSSRSYMQYRGSRLVPFRHSALTGLKLENFRGFPRGSEVIPLGKMTLIFGPNSGGKSTILKAIASFRQSISANLNRVDIKEFSWVPTGQWFDLGARASVIHKAFIESEEAGTEFSIGFQFEVSESRVIPMTLVSSGMLEGEDGIELVFSYDGEETVYDSEGKIHQQLPLENMALLPLTAPHNRAGGFNLTGKHVLIRDLSELSKEDFRDSMAGLALTRGKLMNLLEQIQSVSIDQGGDYDSFFTVKLIGASEALLTRIKRHHQKRLGPAAGQPFLCYVQAEKTSKMATYTFDFNEDEHLARLSRLDLHSDDSGRPYHEIGLKLLDEGSFELSFEDEERQSEMDGWLEANTGVLERSSLVEIITELKKRQTTLLREPENADLSDFVYGTAYDADDLDDWEMNEKLRGMVEMQSHTREGRITEMRERFEEVQRQVWSSLGDRALEKFAEDVSKLPPLRLILVLESLIDVQRTIEDDELRADRAKRSEQIDEILTKYDELCDALKGRKSLSQKLRDFLVFHRTRNRTPSVAGLEAWLSQAKELLPDATPGDMRDLDKLQRFAKQYKAAERNLPKRHQDSLSDAWGSAIDVVDSIDGLGDLANALRANAGNWPGGREELDRISRAWLRGKKSTSVGSFRSRAFEIITVRHPIMEISPSWASGIEERTEMLSWLSEEVSDFVTDLDYLGASRLNPRRIYSFSDATLGGARGDGYRSIAALAAKMVGSSKEANNNKEKFNGYLDQVVGMEAEFRNIRVQAVAVDPNLVTLLVKPTGSENPGMALPDVGYGVSQCIPLLGSTLTGKPLLCEEAESNLHPAAQARLMQCLLHSISESEGADRVPQLVLETHSEHFLKSLTNHLARGEGLSDEDVVILFVDSDPDTGETFAERVETDKGEFLQPWPRDRWDDETNPII